MMGFSYVKCSGKITNNFSVIVTRHRLSGMFTYFYSVLIEKDICDRRYVSIKLPCKNKMLEFTLISYCLRRFSFKIVKHFERGTTETVT